MFEIRYYSASPLLPYGLYDLNEQCCIFYASTGGKVREYSRENKLEIIGNISNENQDDW